MKGFFEYLNVFSLSNPVALQALLACLRCSSLSKANTAKGVGVTQSLQWRWRKLAPTESWTAALLKIHLDFQGFIPEMCIIYTCIVYVSICNIHMCVYIYIYKYLNTYPTQICWFPIGEWSCNPIWDNFAFDFIDQPVGLVYPTSPVWLWK